MSVDVWVEKNRALRKGAKRVEWNKKPSPLDALILANQEVEQRAKETALKDILGIGDD